MDSSIYLLLYCLFIKLVMRARSQRQVNLNVAETSTVELTLLTSARCLLYFHVWGYRSSSSQDLL